MVLNFSMEVARSRRNSHPSFSTEGATLQKIVSKDWATEKGSSVLNGEDEKREAVLKLCNSRWLRDCFKQCIPNSCSTRKRAARVVWFGDAEDDAPSCRSSAVSERELVRKR